MNMEATFYGQRLWLARNFFGYSLEEVGQAVSATRQYIQQIETKAEKKPSEDMVLALADILHVESSFFYQPVINPVSDDQCHFRKLQTTLVSTKNQAIAHGTLFNELAERLEEMLKLPKVNFPHLHPKDLADIERVAEASRIYWGLGVTGPIKNMTRVAEKAGGALVTYFEGVADKVDAFSVQRKRPFIIRNPAKSSVCRMRFDIAHECGHIIMHPGIHTGDKKTEDEANRFASAFLLPRVAFLKEFPKSRKLNWKAVYEMKLRWKVAASAIVRRAYDLSLIDAAQYRTAYIHLRKSGESKSERYDDRLDLIPAEDPELVPHAFTKIQNQAPILMHKITQTLSVKKSFLEKLINMKLNIDNEYENITHIEKFRK